MPAHSVIGAAINMAIYSSSVSKARKSLYETVGKRMLEFGEWGYEFPIDDPIRIDRTKIVINYSLVFYNGKKLVSIRISISPYYGRTSSLHYSDRLKAIAQIYELLQKHTRTIKCPHCDGLMNPLNYSGLGKKNYYTIVYKCPDCKKKINHKRILCPDCNVFMDFLNDQSLYQCPQCDKRFKIKD